MIDIARFLAGQFLKKDIYVLLGASILMYLGFSSRNIAREKIWKEFSGPTGGK